MWLSRVLTTHEEQKKMAGCHRQAPNVQGTPNQECDLHDIELDDFWRKVLKLQ